MRDSQRDNLGVFMGRSLAALLLLAGCGIASAQTATKATTPFDRTGQVTDTDDVEVDLDWIDWDYELPDYDGARSHSDVPDLPDGEDDPRGGMNSMVPIGDLWDPPLLSVEGRDPFVNTLAIRVDQLEIDLDAGPGTAAPSIGGGVPTPGVVTLLLGAGAAAGSRRRRR